jgi:hypothetical protein
MNENSISIELSPTDIDAINWAIAVLMTKLQPVLVALEAEDKSNLKKLEETKLQFVENSLRYTESHSEFLPTFVDAAEMKKDFSTYILLNEFLVQLQRITKNLDDTVTLYGSETILASLAYYNSVKQAVSLNIPTASAIYEDLSQRLNAHKIGAAE